MTDRYAVEFSRASLCDLDEIFTYVAEDSVQNAIRLINRMEDSAKRLGIFPHRAKLERGRNRKEIRKIAVPPYLIFFHVAAEQKKVQILRVWHGARKYPKTFE